MNEPTQPDPPIKPLRWTEKGLRIAGELPSDATTYWYLTEAQARQLYQDLERLLGERD